MGDFSKICESYAEGYPVCPVDLPAGRKYPTCNTEGEVTVPLDDLADSYLTASRFRVSDLPAFCETARAIAGSAEDPTEEGDISETEFLAAFTNPVKSDEHRRNCIDHDAYVAFTQLTELPTTPQGWSVWSDIGRILNDEDNMGELSWGEPLVFEENCPMAPEPLHLVLIGKPEPLTENNGEIAEPLDTGKIADEIAEWKVLKKSLSEEEEYDTGPRPEDHGCCTNVDWPGDVPLPATLDIDELDEGPFSDENVNAYMDGLCVERSSLIEAAYFRDDVRSGESPFLDYLTPEDAALIPRGYDMTSLCQGHTPEEVEEREKPNGED